MSCSMKANPKLRVSEPEASMSMKANPKSEVSEPEASMGMEQCVCCQESMKNVAGCVCQAESNRKSRKVISKPKLLIHTNSEGKFTCSRRKKLQKEHIKTVQANYHSQI